MVVQLAFSTGLVKDFKDHFDGDLDAIFLIDLLGTKKDNGR